MAPPSPSSAELLTLLNDFDRSFEQERQRDFLRNHSTAGTASLDVYYAGNIDHLSYRSVSIVGTRNVSDLGWRRAARLARELGSRGITIVSGLAKGVDTAALVTAVREGYRVAAVIGTPLTKAYPAENGELQEEIWQEHLLMTPFSDGEAVYKSNFPKRNRVMAAISDATVIIEASDTSGTLHQAAECHRLGRWLFIAKSVVDDRTLSWPRKFLDHPKTVVLRETSDIMERIGASPS